MACRYEGRVVQQMIMNDGGKGEFDESTPPMLGIWETLLAVGLSQIPSQALSQISASLQQSAAMHEHFLSITTTHITIPQYLYALSCYHVMKTACKQLLCQLYRNSLQHMEPSLL